MLFNIKSLLNNIFQDKNIKFPNNLSKYSENVPNNRKRFQWIVVPFAIKEKRKKISGNFKEMYC